MFKSYHVPHTITYLSGFGSLEINVNASYNAWLVQPKVLAKHENIPTYVPTNEEWMPPENMYEMNKKYFNANVRIRIVC